MSRDTSSSRTRVLAERPWRTRTTVGERGPFGFLGVHEGSLLYYLARDCFHGDGIIVDAGSFLGRSAWCFARGLADNRGLGSRPAPLVHCFDNFRVNESLTVEAIHDAFGESRPIGASTRDLFDAATKDVAGWLEVHEGDFLSYQWSPRPIEILLVDIAKSPSLNQRLVEMMFPCLIPGQAIVVQQDYHHPWLPHLHATMELLHEYFEIVEPRTDDSAAFRLVRPIPPDTLAAAATAHTQPAATRLALIDAAIARLQPADRRYVQLARAHLLGQERGYEAMADALSAIEPARPGASDAGTWQTYFDQMQRVLEDLRAGLRRGWALLGEGDARGALAIAEAVPVEDAQHADAQVLRAHSLRRLGRVDEAASVIDAAITRRPTEPTAWVEQAWIAVERDRLDEAVASARRGLALASANRQWHAACLDVLAYALSRVGQHDEAIARGSEAVATLPDAVWIREHHAYNLLGAGRRAEAAQAAREVLALAPMSEHGRRVLAAAQQEESA